MRYLLLDRLDARALLRALLHDIIVFWRGGLDLLQASSEFVDYFQAAIEFALEVYDDLTLERVPDDATGLALWCKP